jgi:hypothetical protein
MSTRKHSNRPLLFLGIAALLAIGLWLGIRSLLEPTSFTLNRFEVSAIRLRWTEHLTKDSLACQQSASDPAPPRGVELQLDLTFVTDSTQTHPRYIAPTSPKGREGAKDRVASAGWFIKDVAGQQRTLPDDHLSPIDSACYWATIQAANEDNRPVWLSQAAFPAITSWKTLAEQLNVGRQVPKSDLGNIAYYVWVDPALLRQVGPGETLGFQMTFQSGKTLVAALPPYMPPKEEATRNPTSPQYP